MKKLTLAMLTSVTLSLSAQAAEPLYVPSYGYAAMQPTNTVVAPQPIPDPSAAPAVVVPGAPMPETVVPGMPVIPGRLVNLYPNVRVKDAHKAHPLAIRQVVEIPNPYPRSGCCDPVYVEICVPPHCVPYVSVGPMGQRYTYSYGGYRVVVTSLRGLVTVDYDRR